MNNAEKSARYIQLIRPNGYMNLVAIHPATEEIRGITRDSKSPDLQKFISAHSNDYNIYYTVNEPFKDAPDGKLLKKHIEYIHALYIDKDPAKDKDFTQQREELLGFAASLNDNEIQPTWVIDSGNGVQALWLLKEKMPANDDIKLSAEEHGRGLANKFHSDAIQNIDRILRLPFTKNIPTEKKKKLGRKESFSKVLFASQKKHQWNNLTAIAPALKAPEYDSITDIALDVESLPKSWDEMPILKERFKLLVESDSKLKALYNKEIVKPSRSEYDFSVAQILKSNEWSLDDAAAVLRMFPHGKGMELTKREIVRAYNRAENVYLAMALDDESAEDIMSSSAPSELTIEIKLDENGFEKPKRLSLLKHSDVSAADNSDPLFYGLYEKNSFNVIYGQSNVGKSFVMLDQAVALANGKDWDKFQCAEKMAVIYIFAEAGAGAGKRVDAVRRKHGISNDASVKDFPFFMLNVAVNFLEKPTDKIDDVNDVLLLIAQAERESGLKVGMVVLDTLATTFSGGNENASEDMGSYITNCKKVQQFGSTAVFVVHHAGKDQAAGARGHSSLRAATDTEIEIKAEEKGAGKWSRELIFRKQRETESGTKIKFGLSVIELGLNKLSLPITSCYVVLEGDSDYQNVIPSVVDGLTDSFKAMYYAVLAANVVGNNNQTIINAFYKWYMEDISNYNKSYIEVGKIFISQGGIRTKEFNTQRNNVANALKKLVELELISLDSNKCYVIV